MELSRRKILGSIGAVGAAGAGAGLGTSALFSDTESFVNNSITAGQFDLKIDWEEHYSFPQIYGFDDPTDGRNVIRTDPADDDTLNEDEYTALPVPGDAPNIDADPLVWVRQTDFDNYFADTVIEAFPDQVGDPVTADFSEEGSAFADPPCEVLADVPPDLDTYNDNGPGGIGEPARTRNGDTYDDDSGDFRPLISLEDVKPGDFGELTLSTHLCDNDGYLWLSMPGGLTENDNGLTDAEESFGNDSTGGDGEGELAENIQTALWYDDDCSNTLDGEPQDLLAMALIDVSGSLTDPGEVGNNETSDLEQIADASNEFVEQLFLNSEVNVEAGVMTFSGADTGSGGRIRLENPIEPLEKSSDYLNNSSPPEGQFEPGTNLLPGDTGGSTPMAPAIDLAREVLNDRETEIQNSNSSYLTNPRKEILVISDGTPSPPEGGLRYKLTPGINSSTDDNDSNNVPDDVEASYPNDEGDIQAGDQFVSDKFDGLADNDPNTGPAAETLLVARDVDTSDQEDSDQYDDDIDISGSDGIQIRSIAIDSGDNRTDFSDLIGFMGDLATNGTVINTTVQNLAGEIGNLVDNLNVSGPAEKVIFDGTLKELEAEMDPGQDGPIPLDGMSMDDNIDELAADPSVDRPCFSAADTQCFGFAWWVPTEVGNVIQGDSVAFDLQFLAEQCRNNDDPGQTVLSD